MDSPPQEFLPPARQSAASLLANLIAQRDDWKLHESGLNPQQFADGLRLLDQAIESIENLARTLDASPDS